MPQRLAAVSAFIVFAICLIVGMIAGNTFVTTVARALLAMAGTFVIGLIVGLMGEKMLDENLRSEAEKLKNSEGKTDASDR